MPLGTDYPKADVVNNQEHWARNDCLSLGAFSMSARSPLFRHKPAKRSFGCAKMKS
jgi:hypothetical protein